MPSAPASEELRPLLKKAENSKKHYNTVGLSQGAFWALVFATLISAFLCALDTTIVAALLSPISSTFKASNLASWLGTSYGVANCCITPIFGRMCNILGRQTSMMLALIFFTVGTVGCASAPTMSAMIAARAVAGLGGGGIATVGNTIMSDVVPLNRRGIFQGYANLMFCAGVAGGPALGGLMQDTVGWRWAFWLQLPIMAGVVFCNYRFVRYELPSGPLAASNTPEQPAETAWDKIKRIDFLGTLLLGTTLLLILVPMSMVTDAPDPSIGPNWTDPRIVGQLCAAGVSLLVFLLVELKIAKEPVMPFNLLRRRTALSGATSYFLIGVFLFALMYTTPLYLIVVKQFSASVAGRRLALNAPCTVTSSFLAGFYIKRFGTYKYLGVIGSTIATVGVYLMTTWTQTSPANVFWWQYPVVLFGLGNVFSTNVVGMIADVGREHVAMATALAFFTRTTGQVFGIAFSGALLQVLLGRELPKLVTGPHKQEVIDMIRRSSASIGTLPEDQKQAAIAAYDYSIGWIFKACLGLASLGTLVLFGMQNINVNAVRATEPEVASAEGTEDEEA